MKRMDSGPLGSREMRKKKSRDSFAAPNHNSRWCCAGERLSHTPIAQPPVDHPASRSQLPGKQHMSGPWIISCFKSQIHPSCCSTSCGRVHRLIIHGKRGHGLLPSPQSTHNQDSKLKYPNLLRISSVLAGNHIGATKLILRCSTRRSCLTCLRRSRMLLMEAWFWCILCSSRILLVSGFISQACANPLLKLPWVNSI